MASALLESLLERDGAESAGHGPAWLDTARRSAATALARDGFPGPRSEAWKYTSLRALEQRRYQNGDAEATTRTVDPARFHLGGIEGPRLVFVNGKFRGDLSSSAQIEGMTVSTLAAATAGDRTMASSCACA